MRKFFPLMCILYSLFYGIVFAAEGDVIWTRTHNDSGDGDDRGYGIAVDASGNVYVTGYETVAGQGCNVWVRKYDPDGNEVWTRTYNGAADNFDIGYGIAVDASGNVYVTGYETVAGEGENIWLRKYDSNGNEVWTRTYNGTADSWDRGYGIAVDASGNVYVTGCEYVTDEGPNIWLRKYDPDGEEVWTMTYDGTDGWADAAYGIAADRNGNVYVTGTEYVAGESNNIWVRKYDPWGNEIWTSSYDGANNLDIGYDIAIDRSGNAYVTGYQYVSEEELNIWVGKYEGAFGQHFEPPTEGAVKIQGGKKGYVNPLKGEVAKIHFKPSGAGTVNVKIFTLRGLLVWEKSKQASGFQDFIEWNCRNTENSVVASGIYLVYVDGPGIKATKKVAILK